MPKVRLSQQFSHVGTELAIGPADPYPDVPFFSDLPGAPRAFAGSRYSSCPRSASVLSHMMHGHSRTGGFVLS